MSRLLALALFFASIPAAFAYNSVTGTVVSIRIDEDGRGMVFFSQPLTGTLSCVHGAYANALAFDSNTAGGKAILATALAAKTSGSPVSAIGKGTCTIYGNASVEDWSYGHLN